VCQRNTQTTQLLRVVAHSVLSKVWVLLNNY